MGRLLISLRAPFREMQFKCQDVPSCALDGDTQPLQELYLAEAAVTLVRSRLCVYGRLQEIDRWLDYITGIQHGRGDRRPWRTNSPS